MRDFQEKAKRMRVWSQSNYSDLTDEQHKANNLWFKNAMGANKHRVCVIELDKCWDFWMNEEEMKVRHQINTAYYESPAPDYVWPKSWLHS